MISTATLLLTAHLLLGFFIHHLLVAEFDLALQASGVSVAQVVQALGAQNLAAPVGRLESCGPGFGYAVREIENPNILRQTWTGITTALAAEGAVPPMAEVVITDPAGVDVVFASPPPVHEDN